MPKVDQYEAAVKTALDQSLIQALEQEAKEGIVRFDLNKDRWIIFSDHHRGGRNRADDFRLAERAYNAALAYYYRMGHTLVILGDAEELWEEHPRTVMKTYDYSLRLEAKFHQEDRYLRFWGNHDDDWQYPEQVEKHLQDKFGQKPLKVRETLQVRVMDGTQDLGSLLLLHGHQGTTASDRYAKWSKFFVRYFWRPYQRLSGISLNTPAQDWELRERHNIALYSWAAQQEKVILIAGHTHRPVFSSRSYPARIMLQLAVAEADYKANPTDVGKRDVVGQLAAELEWVRGQENQAHGPEGMGKSVSKPCYFNTGCCSFSDGDITGIEISDGQIRLVRLPTKEHEPIPQVLETDFLTDVLEFC